MSENLEIIESNIRKSLSEEQEAISMYLNRKTLFESMKDSDVDIDKLNTLIYTINDILEEEKVHVGQLREMLKLFDFSFEKEQEGEEEAKKDSKNESFSYITRRLRKYIKE